MKIISREKILFFAPILILLLGALNIALWNFCDAKDKLLFINYYLNLNAWLWLALHGRLICGITLLFFGLVGLVNRQPGFLIFLAGVLVLTGLCNVLNDVFSIPGLRKYDHVINVGMVLQDLNIIWLIIGILQIGFAIFYVKNHRIPYK